MNYEFHVAPTVVETLTILGEPEEEPWDVSESLASHISHGYLEERYGSPGRSADLECPKWQREVSEVLHELNHPHYVDPSKKTRCLATLWMVLVGAGNECRAQYERAEANAADAAAAREAARAEAAELRAQLAAAESELQERRAAAAQVKADGRESAELLRDAEQQHADARADRERAAAELQHAVDREAGALAAARAVVPERWRDNLDVLLALAPFDVDVTELTDPEYTAAMVKRALRGLRKLRDLEREVNEEADADTPDPAAKRADLRDRFGTG